MSPNVAVSVLGLGRVGLTAWRLASGPAPLPAGVALVTRAHLLARTVLPLLALYLGVSVWGVLGSGDPRPIRSSPRLLRQLKILGMELLDLVADRTQIADILDDVVSRFEARGA